VLYICGCSSCYMYEIHPFRSTSERTEFGRPSLYLWAIEWKTEFIAIRSKKRRFPALLMRPCYSASRKTGDHLPFLPISNATTSLFIICES